MKQSIIGEIYVSWTKGELKKLNKFISTSHWSKSETIVLCHQSLANAVSKGKMEILDKERLFEETYPNEDYNDSKLRFTLNRLLEAVKEFVLLEENERTNIYTEKVWLDFIQNKKLKKNSQALIDSKIDPQDSHSKFLFHYFQSVHKGSFSFQFQNSTDSRFNALLEITKNAEIFADYVFLRQYCLLITFAKVFQSTEFQLANTRYQEIKEKKWNLLLPEFEVYISLIELLTTNLPENYYIYKQNVFKYFHFWADEDKVTLISYLINYSTAQINKGDIEFIEEQFNLYTYFEENRIFSIPNYINTTRINNVIHIYLRKKEFSRAEQFIEDYVPLLPKDIMDSCRHFNLARIRFEKRVYKESLRELLQVDFGRDAFYSINSKVLLLKNYFELKESDALASLVISFKEYIKKNKVISETHKVSIINFLKTVDKIYGATSVKAKKLDEEIKKHTQIVEKSWLLEKITEKTK